MSQNITKVQRWLDLIALLAGRRIPLEVEEIMERVPAYARQWVRGSQKDRESVRRTFERDKDELTELGIPLRAERMDLDSGRETLEGYRLQHADFYLPYLRLVSESARAAPPPYRKVSEVALTEEEAGVAADALRRVADLPAFPFAAEARSAFRKLAFDLEMDRFTDAPLLWLHPPEQEEVRERLRLLTRALFARKRVSFRYHGILRGEPTEREVEPYGVFFQRDWYLVGFDRTRAAVRVFRIAGMETVRPNARAPKSPDYEIPADFRVQEYTRREAWELGDQETDTIEAKVRFGFPASLQAEHAGWGEPVQELADGSSIRKFRVRQPDTFVRWILAQEGDAEVVAPEQLRNAVTTLAAEVVALYRRSPADG